MEAIDKEYTDESILEMLGIPNEDITEMSHIIFRREIHHAREWLMENDDGGEYRFMPKTEPLIGGVVGISGNLIVVKDN